MIKHVIASIAALWLMASISSTGYGQVFKTTETPDLQTKSDPAAPNQKTEPLSRLPANDPEPGNPKLSTGAEGSVDAAKTELRIIYLQSSNSMTTVGILHELFHAPSLIITADPRTNAIIIRAPAELLAQIEALAQQLDRPNDTPESLPNSASGTSTSTTGRSRSPKTNQADDMTKIEALRRTYDQKEQDAAATAQELKQLRAGSSPDSRQATSLQRQLTQDVSEAFLAREKLHRAEIAELRTRIDELQQTMSLRNNLQKEIIERRVQDLLNPDLRWDGETSSNTPSDKPTSTRFRRGFSRGTSTGAADTGSDLNPSRTSADPNILVPGQPLSHVVREFNEKHSNDAIGKDQPPLTDDEIVAALRWSTSTDSSRKLDPEDVRLLQAIANQRVLPPTATVDLRTDFDEPDGGKLTKWTILLTVKRPDRPPFEHLLREQLIRWKPAAGNENQTPPQSTNPKDTPLVAAIRAFNLQQASDPIGKDQPLLTEDEVLAAIHWWKTKRNEANLTNEEFQAFQAIAETRALPDKVEFEVITGFQPNEEFSFKAWSVRIRMPRSQQGWTYAFTIRDRWIESRRLGDRQISWGAPASNGLQAGLYFERSSDEYITGEQIIPRFFYRNTGSETLEVSFPRLMTHGYYRALRAVDSAGRDIAIDQDPGPGGPVGWVQTSIPPGKMHMISGLALVLGEVSRDPVFETVVRVKPGQACRIHYLVPNYAEPDSEPLATGEIRFALTR